MNFFNFSGGKGFLAMIQNSEAIKGNTGTPHFTMLRRFCVFYKLKLVSTLRGASLSAPFFPTGFAHFVSQCHILVILTMSQMYSFLLLIFVMVICDQ